MLEQQQEKLVAGLRELYSRLESGQSWPGEALRRAQGGYPLTHDILERLNLLHPSGDNNSNYEGFEEDCRRMQQNILQRGTLLLRHQGSIGTDSDHQLSFFSGSPYGGKSTLQAALNEDLVAQTHSPPATLLTRSSFSTQPQVVPPIEQAGPMDLSAVVGTETFDPSQLDHSVWTAEYMLTDEARGFDAKPMYAFETLNFDFNATVFDPGDINPAGPLTPGWNDPNDLDFSSFVQSHAGL